MAKESIYERWFGIKPFIPFGYPWGSPYGGARLPDEVIKAMEEAARYKVDMRELLIRVGKTVAEMIGAEAAFITSSGSAALTLAAAAVMTGKDPAKIMQLPETDHPIKLKNEFVVQVGAYHRYLPALQAAGGKLVWVGGRGSTPIEVLNTDIMKTLATGFRILPEEIEEAITERTAALIAVVHTSKSVIPPMSLSAEEIVRIGRKYNIPTIADACHLPVGGGQAGKNALRRYLDIGVDLVCLSGGKAIEGPNDTGILYGRKDLIEAAAPQGASAFPLNAGTSEETLLRWEGLGRGFKVSKEQIVGLVAALRKYLNRDDQEIIARDTAICEWMADQFSTFPHVKSLGVFPEGDWPHDTMIEGGPCCILQIDEEALGITISEIAQLMLEGDPPLVSMAYCTNLAPWEKLQLFSHGLREGEEKAAISKLKKILLSKLSKSFPENS